MSERIAVIGLGYVGLPLALELGHHFPLVGMDIDPDRVRGLRSGIDRTDEVDSVTLGSSTVQFTTSCRDLASCTFFVIAVPTPVQHDGRPALDAMHAASIAVGALLKPGDVVVYECTVYPGLTEETCGPWLERASGLRIGKDIGLGYSPERINPGDHVHTLRSIPKVISAADPATLSRMAAVYGSVVKAGLHQAPDIRTAEACKVIENAQRNVNIAFMNEVTVLLDGIGVSTTAVMKAMATKWNHLPFHPGLVGGHCIGVDPYYLVECAKKAGTSVPLLQQALRTNADYVDRIADQLERRLGDLRGQRVGVLGLPYKPDVLDLRNTRVPDLARAIEARGATVLLHDPTIEADIARELTGVVLQPEHAMRGLHALVIAVPHQRWRDNPEHLVPMLQPGGLIFDPHGKVPPTRVPASVLHAAV